MIILFDIGGTKTRIAVCENLDAEIDVVAKISTQETPEKTFSQAKEEITQAENLSLDDVSAVAIAIAGVVNKEEKTLAASPNLSGWVGKKLTSYLSDVASEKDIVVANDTALGALGESHHGAGSPQGVMAYLTVGTGVGGSRIIDGKIDVGRYGFEPGHQIVDMSEFLSAADYDLPEEGMVPGHLEFYLSGANIEAATGRAPADVVDEEVWREFQDRLAAALSNITVMWSPEEIVLGGSMIMRNEYLSFAYLQKALERQLQIFPEVPLLQRAQLQDEAGLVGAREYLKQVSS